MLFTINGKGGAQYFKYMSILMFFYCGNFFLYYEIDHTVVC